LANLSLDKYVKRDGCGRYSNYQLRAANKNSAPKKCTFSARGIVKLENSMYKMRPLTEATCQLPHARRRLGQITLVVDVGLARVVELFHNIVLA